MKFLFLNQYFPPDPAPTGSLMAELAARLVCRGHEVELVGAEDGYRSSPKGRGRLLREAAALWRLLRAGMAAKRPAMVFAGSSPPCLALAADKVARWHRAKLAHWAMDLYPDLAVALGEVGAGAITRTIAGAMRRAHGRAALLVAVDDDMRRLFETDGLGAETISPWVLSDALGGLTAEALALPSGGGGLWVYSGNLGRAHDWETLVGAQAIMERREVPATLRFQGGGAGREPAMRRAADLGLKRCEWAGYSAPDRLVPDLMAAEVVVATQREATRGLLWPSKLALLAALPRPLLWVGPERGAVAESLRGVPGAGVFAPGDAAGVAGWIEAAVGGQVPQRVALDARAKREAALEQFAVLLERVAGSGKNPEPIRVGTALPGDPPSPHA